MEGMRGVRPFSSQCAMNQAHTEEDSMWTGRSRIKGAKPFPVSCALATSEANTPALHSRAGDQSLFYVYLCLVFLNYMASKGHLISMLVCLR